MFRLNKSVWFERANQGNNLLVGKFPDAQSAKGIDLSVASRFLFRAPFILQRNS